MTVLALFQTSLVEFVKSRAGLAMTAFERVRTQQASTRSVAPEVGEKTVGWLYPAAGGSPERFALVPGNQYLLAGKAASVERDSSFAASCAASIEVLRDRVEVTVKGGGPLVAQVLYHGDELVIGTQSFRLAMLPARALARSFKTLFSVLCILSIAAFVAPSAHAQSVRAGFRENFSVREVVQGGVSLRASQVQARVGVGAESYLIPVLGVRPAPAHYLILYDGSVLCASRKMEAPLNQEIADLLQRLDPEARVTLVRYDLNQGAENSGHINYERVFPAGSKVRSIQANIGSGSLVTCNPRTLSVNGLLALTELAKQVFGTEPKAAKNATTDERRVAILFSSGHVAPTASVDVASLQALELASIRAVVFSPVENELVNVALAPFKEISTVTWWTKPEPLHLASILSYAWDFDLRADLPATLPAGSYRLDLTFEQNGKPAVLSNPLQYGLNGLNLFWYRLWTFFWLGSAVLLVIYFTYRLIRYYRVPRCRAKGHALSRQWNDCLFCAAGQRPVLLVEGAEHGLEKAFVIRGPLTRIGGRFADHLKLKGVRSVPRVRVRRALAESYEISAEAGAEFVLNGERRSQPMFLRHGDRIGFGHYELRFLFLKNEESKNDVAI